MPRYLPVTNQCEVCHNPFTVAYRFRGTKTCNKECFKKLMSSKKRTERIKKQCLNDKCGKIFDLKITYENIQKYCSQICFYDHKYGRESAIVTLICKSCGNDFDRVFSKRRHRCCSKKCFSVQQSLAMMGKNNPMFGKGPMLGRVAWNNGKTTETDDRLKNLGREVSRSLQRGFESGKLTHVGENNPNFGRTRETRSIENLENYSKAASQRVIDGVSCNNKNFMQGNFFSKKQNESFHYRSSYELRLMLCYEVDEDIISYEHEPFVIKYDEGKRYIPDVLILKNSCEKAMIVEVKPEMFLQNLDVVEKANAARDYCDKNDMTYEFITLNDIVRYEKTLSIDSERHKNLHEQNSTLNGGVKYAS